MEWINLFFITFHLAFRFTFFQKHMRLNTKNDFQKLNSLVQIHVKSDTMSFHPKQGFSYSGQEF